VLIPCIDLQDGQAVQLVHGRRRELAVADVLGLLEKFRRYSWLHVIDLDAAMGKKRNDHLTHQLCVKARKQYGMKVRIGGGIRTTSRAAMVVRWGADQIIIGSTAFRDGKVNTPFLRRLLKKVAKKRIVIALDTAKGRIVTHGWRRTLQLRPQQVISQLEPFCAAFLCTDVDREGTMRGAKLEWFRELRAATPHPIIAAGGIRTRREVSALEKIAMDAAVGMAVYKNYLR
jgi:phosphoribosylformimino-5-aminoimidazole carboxamide ribotide isomerase